MVRHPIRLAILLGVLTAVAVSPARAAEQASQPAPKSTGPTMKTIKVTECVEEKYPVKRTCYKMECRQETVEGFRCETVCEQRERVCTVVKRVPVMTTETRRVCHYERVCEERTTMKTCYEYRQVTCNVKKCVSKGHWECKEVCQEPGFFEKLCNPCACGHTVTKKCWVSCPVYVDCPVTKCQKVCVQKPVVCKVNVCKPVYKEEKVQVCSYRCVEEKVVQKYTEHVTKKVPCKTTRTVRVCVPYEETVWCTRMVPRTVERQVAECETTCCTPCCTPSRSCCRSRGGLFHRQNCCD
jgi:hypothetical protein